MDFNKLAIPQNAVEKELVMPDGTKTGVILQLISTDHKKYIEAERKISFENFKQMSDKKGNIKFSLDRAEKILIENWASDIERAACCIVGWSGITENGEPLPYSHEKAVELLFKEGSLWIVEQIQDFVSDRVNFMKG